MPEIGLNGAFMKLKTRLLLSPIVKIGSEQSYYKYLNVNLLA